MLLTVLIVILILMLVGAIPRWGYNNTWGNGPWAVILIILLVVILLGYR